MAIQQKLQTRLSQKLVLTPSLQQAIKLLPMSTVELVELLNQEVVENPLLEEIPDEGPPAESAEPKESAESAETPAAEGQDAWDDADYEYFFGDYLDEGYRARLPTEFKELPPIENTLSTGTSLSDHLLWQLRMQADDEFLYDIGTAIVGNLDEDGRLAASVEEIAALGEWQSADVDRAIRVVQTLDPIGVAARDPQECLLLQLRHWGRADTRAETGESIFREHLPCETCETLVRDHYPLLQNQKLPELARRLGATIGALKMHVDVVRQLDPKPGSRLNAERSQYVIPDVSIIKVEDDYVAVLNDERVPQLRISPVYRRMMSKASESSEETRAYVKKKLESAKWLIKSVDQRQRTIHKVATSIIGFQRGFLDHGISHLRPLVLRDVANDIGMHESTVSRVVTNKYMHTPQGVFEMKYFFHSGISSAYGETVSSVKVKERIRKIVAEEDPRKPLSDSRIVRLLQDEGLVLARRTIAKYREELKIPTSSRRRVHY
jgi:RNA polymerase sigma-54 factor